MATERCDLTELVVDQCSHCLGQDKPVKPRATGPTISAQYPGTCACGCKTPFTEGDQITHSTDADGWCLPAHVQED